MGSLERVQFKFASIIGELCSEPILLSQFAVWLDLKLAEYKAKGSISLDCSGEKPEPPWMKGVLPLSPASLPTALFEEGPSGDANNEISPFLKSSAQTSQNSNFLRNQNQNSNVSDRDSFTSEMRLKSDEDFIMIKEEKVEQNDCIYEPNNRLNDTVPEQSMDNYSETAFRKRLNPSDSHFTSSHNINSPTKIRRMGPASASTSSPSSAASNQSNPGTSRDMDPSSLDRSMFSPGDISQSQNTWLGQVTADREPVSPVPEAAEVPDTVHGQQFQLQKRADAPIQRRTCNICGIVFTRKASYQIHYDTKHAGTNVSYKCHCGKSYAWRPSFQRHQRKCFAKPT